MSGRIPSRYSPAIFCLALTFLSAGAAVSEQFFVDIMGQDFVPATLTIAVGDTITWRNDGGLNNVVDRGGKFHSGSPSTDQWQYSYTFSSGGTYQYDSESGGMVGEVVVEGLFESNFNDGHLGDWSELEPPRPDCSCYFSSDCADGTFCNYGPGGFGREDICSWVDNKPQGSPGAGCDRPHTGVWGGEICDGVCRTSLAGSPFGHEPVERVRDGISMWAEAILLPAESGGGPIREDLVEQIEQLGFQRPDAPRMLGRQVTDLLILTGGRELYDYFCYHEQHPEEPDPNLYVDFSDQPCRTALARLTIDGLLAAMDGQDVEPVIDLLPSQCKEWPRIHVERCPLRNDALGCLVREIEQMAIFLTTPDQHSAAAVLPQALVR